MGTCLNNFTAKSKVTWTDLNNSYAASQFYHGFAYPGGMSYTGGAQDNSVSRGSDIGGMNTWGLFGTGDGTSVAIDPADANHTLASKQNLSLARAIDGATYVGSVAGITETAARFPFVPPLAWDPKEGNHVFLGGTVNLWRSLDGGATWMAAAPVEAKSSVTAIAVSPADSNTVLFGTQLGFVYSNPAALAANGNTPWISSKPRSGNVSGLTYDPNNPQIVYATYSTLKSLFTDAHVYKSLDGGATWSPSDGSASASIPDTPVFRLLVNPYDSSILYLGSDLGVFVSTDGGATWGHDPNEFSNVIVQDLAFDSISNPNWLFAFPYGRGAWRTPLAGAPLPSCTYSVTPTAIDADAYGGVTPVNVSAPAGCAWSGIPGLTPTAFQVQSPAQGVGDGTAFVNVEPNAGAARSDKLDIANTIVTVNQSAASTIVRTLSDLSTAPATLAVPGIASISSSTLTSTSSDPVHSCTGSADFKSAWWRVTPTSGGTLQIQAAGRRSDIYGNSGIAITAYAGTITGAELACATVPQDTSSQIDGVIRFNVSAGTTYLVEVSALGSGSSYNGTLTVAATMAASADVVLSLTPSSARVAAGGNPAQFTAEVSNAANTAVRWSITPPIGSISLSGVYTPPPSLSAPVSITIAATTFALPFKQATATVIVIPAGSSSGSAPVISSVFNAASGAATIAPNAWITLIGTNLAPDTRPWQGSDFIGGQMPTQLDSVTVTIGGRRAFVYYISSTQVNVLAPVGGLAGSEPVVLTNSDGSSAPVTVSQAAFSPSFFLFGGKYVAATHANGTYLGPEALGAGFTPASPGDTVILYGNGFGQISPAIIPGSGSQSGTLPVKPTITIGGLNATVSFAGAISPGLYQFNVVVPANATNGDNAVAVTYQGVSGPSGIYLSIAKQSSAF
jgi:uncharacterized protein (TIGR03437 family)